MYYRDAVCMKTKFYFESARKIRNIYKSQQWIEFKPLILVSFSLFRVDFHLFLLSEHKAGYISRYEESWKWYWATQLKENLKIFQRQGKFVWITQI